MSNKNILVLGSKPDSKLPDIEVEKIYTANGAAERALNYKKKYPTTPLTCLVGAAEFVRNYRVRERIIKSHPERLIVRGHMGLPKELQNNCDLICYDFKSQWNFQKKFFNNSNLTMLMAEYFYHTNYIKKMTHFLKHLKHKNFQGISTGFFSILMALEENLDSDIIVSGIGMKGGKQFYKSERSNFFVYDSRARVDRYLINKLPKRYKDRISTLDTGLAEIDNISMWSGNFF